MKTNVLDSWTDTDLEIQRNGVIFLELKTENRIIANQLIQCGSNLKTQEIDTIAPLDLIIKRGGVAEIEVKDNETQFNCNISLNGFTVRSNAFDTTGDV